MNLYEFEGKQMLYTGGMIIPKSQLLTSFEDKILIDLPIILKAQVLSGKRKKAGGIIEVNNKNELQDTLKKLFASEINKEKVNSVLIEEKIEHTKEYYCSLCYDTDNRGILLTISSLGGINTEENEHKQYQISILNPIAPDTEIPKEILEKIISIFLTNDCLLLEINPLVKYKDDWIALDAKIKLDDDAKKRHPEWDFAYRSAPGHRSTEQEKLAKQIDAQDYRGTAGSAYFDLDGDIAILASGGGVSLVALDALSNAGGKAANYTEYSGNPPKEKVVKLTKIVLSKPNINGLWIIGTVAANFTDIYETLMGIVDSLYIIEKETGKKIDFPIVIRRGGPRDKEAFEKIQQTKDFDFYLQGPETSIEKSAQTITQLAKKYASIT